MLTLDPGLKERILRYENIQSICSLEKFHIKDPTEDELIDLRGAIVEISGLAHRICGKQPVFAG